MDMFCMKTTKTPTNHLQKSFRTRRRRRQDISKDTQARAFPRFSFGLSALMLARRVRLGDAFLPLPPMARPIESSFATPSRYQSHTYHGATVDYGIVEADDSGNSPRTKKKKKKLKTSLHIEDAMRKHELLSKEEEMKLAQQYQDAKQLGEKLHLVIDEKVEDLKNAELDDDDFMESEDEMDFDMFADGPDYATNEFSFSALDDQTLEKFHRRSLVDEAKFWEERDFSPTGHNSVMMDMKSLSNPGVMSLSSVSAAMDILSEDDVAFNLGMSKKKVHAILLRGAAARDRLIRCNLKLVYSIANKWSFLYARADGKMYTQTWDRPGLSEILQEGSIGLATAVERFNPQRDLRLSTYATFWVTNAIRRCFQYASTPLVKLPTRVYELKTMYIALVTKHLTIDGHVPPVHVLAKEMDIGEKRLMQVLDMTRSTIQLDSPEFSTLGADGLIDEGEDPEAALELSFLRQSLESAMAAELSPHERDVLRLRLGLDDGVTRSVRQVVSEFGESLTFSQIRGTERRALKKLRSPVALATYKLLAFVDPGEVDAEELSKT